MKVKKYLSKETRKKFESMLEIRLKTTQTTSDEYIFYTAEEEINCILNYIEWCGFHYNGKIIVKAK